jgi:integrase
MARTIHRLTAQDLKEALMQPGKHHDGGGLYLIVRSEAAAYWQFRYGPQGRYTAGLGPLHTLLIEIARERAAECRQMLLDGNDPRTELNKRRAQVRTAARPKITFKIAVAAYLDANASKWDKDYHNGQRYLLRTLAEPVIGGDAIDAITTEQVLQVLTPQWRPKDVHSGMRLCRFMAAVLDYAKARGWRSGDNPATWYKHIDKLLPHPNKISPPQHMRSLPYAELPDFMRQLRAVDRVASYFTRFVILTCVRNTEARGARWPEIGEDGIWTIPPPRMKEKREHRVPLSAAARDVLDHLRGNGSEFIFDNGGGKPVNKNCYSDLPMIECWPGAPVLHGYRATFKTWAEECTSYPSKLIESALAHLVGDSETERAYQRGDFLERRRELMEAWAHFATGADNIVELRAATS